MSVHATSIGLQAGPGGMYALWATCTCGWSGQIRATRDEAEHDAHEHKEAARRPRSDAARLEDRGRAWMIRAEITQRGDGRNVPP